MNSKTRQAMKKYIYSVIAASCAILASCSQDEQLSVQPAEPQAKAVTEVSASSGVESRAKVDGSDNTKINWESGDKLKVFGKDASSAAASADYTLSSTAGTTSGTFTNASSTVTTIDAYMYPAQSTATWDADDSKLTCNIPTVQTATAGSFDKDAAIMYHIGSESNATLKSAVAFLKVKIDNSMDIGKNVHAITISSASSYLSGNIEVSSTGVEIPSDVSGSVKSVTLVASQTDPSAVLADGTYYIAVKPGEIASPSISYTYINKGTDTHSSYSSNSTTHFATVKTKASSNSGSLSVNAGHVKTIGISDWGSTTSVYGVQLWENGPYFAEYNIGATNEYTVGTSQNWGITGSVTAEDGILPARYDNATQTWSSAWRVPTKDELDGIVGKADASNKKVLSYTYGTHTSQTSQYGWNVLGATGYGSLFLPADDGIADNGNASYWSSTADGSYAYYLYLSYNGGVDNSDWDSDNQSNKGYVRPVLR